MSRTSPVEGDWSDGFPPGDDTGTFMEKCRQQIVIVSTRFNKTSIGDFALDNIKMY